VDYSANRERAEGARVAEGASAEGAKNAEGLAAKRLNNSMDNVKSDPEKPAPLISTGSSSE